VIFLSTLFQSTKAGCWSR